MSDFLCLKIYDFFIMDYYSKGYRKALRDAGGDESEVHYNYGWYGSLIGAEYDDDGNPIPFT